MVIKESCVQGPATKLAANHIIFIYNNYILSETHYKS
jgi:hypothetical protein